MSDLFGVAGRQLLAELSLPPFSQQVITTSLQLIDTISQEVKGLDQQIKLCFRDHPALPRLLPIPGIGMLAASTVIAEVWDVTRFRRPEELCSWAGLTPTERSSAEHIRRGHISKQGSRWLRWMMVEAATNRCTHDPHLRAFEIGIARRRGPKIARVALARRLLTLCFYALRDDAGCRQYPVAA